MNIRPCFAANHPIAAIATFLFAFLFTAPFNSRAFLHQQLDSNQSNSTQNTAQQLELGKPIVRELTDGQSHSYQLRIPADQYVKLTVKQRAIDLKLQLYAPDNKLLVEWDRQWDREGMEVLPWAAEAEGNYRLEVVSASSESKVGSYEIKWLELRAANEKERKQTQVYRLLHESAELLDKEKYDEAILKARGAVQMMESLWEPDHVEIGDALMLLGLSLDAKGDYVAAEPLYQRALAIRKKNLGPEHPYVAHSLTILANLYYSIGKYELARSLHQQGLRIKEKIQGPDGIAVAAALNDLAVLNLRRGDYTTAESQFQRALAIFEERLGQEHRHVASTLDNLALIYHTRGDYGKAEPLMQRALAIREKVLGPEHPHVTHSLNNLAGLYGDKGDYIKAETLFLQALAIKEKILGSEHPSTAVTLHSLAELYVNKKNYSKAEMYLQRAQSITEKSFDAEHADMALVLRDSAMLYFQMGKDAMALSLLERALEISERALGREHDEVAVVLSNLANISHSQADYTKAKMLHQRSLAIREKSLGREHPDVATSLDKLADLYIATDDLPQAVSLRLHAAKVSEHNIGLNLLTGSDRQKQAYLTMLTSETNRIVSLHVRSAPADVTARELALTTILQRKGRALDAMTDTLAVLRRRANTQDQPLFEQLSEVTSQLARSILNRPERIAPADHQQQIRALEEQKEKLEADISTRSTEFRTQSQPVTLAVVQEEIPDKTALVEYFAYRPFNAKYQKEDEAFGPARYVAYILRHQGEIHWIELGEAKVIDEAIGKLRQAIRCPQNLAEVRRLARALDAKLMQPVRARLGQAQHLIVSPDGALNHAPFAALVDENGKYLIEKYQLSHLTSGRDLLRLKVARESKTPPLIIANPDFGLGKEETLALRAPAPQCDQAKQVEGEQKDFQKINLDALPWTIQEASDLKKLLPKAKLLIGAQATETALKQSGAPSLLHIATHGFFLQDAESPLKGTRGFDFSTFSDLRSASWASKIENPLLRSGLAFEGFNEHRNGDDDGVLTAMEAANLDLWGTKLVVLSACDTGLGEIKNGEGVYGLRRALVLAGAETQVMSLWSVPDKETRSLMKGYYQRLLDKKKKEGRGEALRQVQLEMLKTPGHQHPFYWASFIQVGEWANLDGKR
ncbi:MAG: hypothetical protein HONDAALG_03860 [Gammaproteobacteria bacterium]|nr:hypothetical protein [Gammaproteobacteria bacterium]